MRLSDLKWPGGSGDQPGSAPVPRYPDPPARPLRPVTRNPARAGIRAGDIASGYPDPAMSAPAPVAGLPDQCRPRQRRDHLLLGRRGSAGRPIAVSGIGIGRRLGGSITRRLTWSRIGRRRVLLCKRRWHPGEQSQGPDQGASARPGDSGGCSGQDHGLQTLPVTRPSSDGSCRVVSCPRTGSAMASARLRTPFHSEGGRTCPSLPI